MIEISYASGSVEPERNAAGRISTAPTELWSELQPIAMAHGAELHWNHGVGTTWRVIVALPTECELTRFIAAGGQRAMARAMIAEIVHFVDVPTITLSLELDSEERVNAAEGWFFRLKSDPAPGCEFTFSSSEIS